MAGTTSGAAAASTGVAQALAPASYLSGPLAVIFVGAAAAVVA